MIYLQKEFFLHLQSMSFVHIQRMLFLHIQSMLFLNILSMLFLNIQSILFLNILSMLFLNMQSMLFKNVKLSPIKFLFKNRDQPHLIKITSIKINESQDRNYPLFTLKQSISSYNRTRLEIHKDVGIRFPPILDVLLFDNCKTIQEDT